MIGAIAAGVPHIAEQRVDPRARAEGREALARLPRKHLIEMVAAHKRESEAHNADLRRAMAYWWDLWQNRVSFGDKEDWQTQIWIPKPFTAAEQAASLIQRSLLEGEEPFGVDGRDQRSRLRAVHVWKPLVKMAWDGCHFIPKFSDAAKVGFITGIAGYWKFRWQRTRIPVLVGAELDPVTGEILPAFRYRQRSFLAVDFVLPWNIWRDPRSKPRENFSGSYLIHGEWKDRAMLRAMAEAGWDPPAVAELLGMKGGGEESGGAGTSGTTSRQAEAQRRGQTYEPSEYRQDYFVDEWWGDVVDTNGDPVFPDAMMTTSTERLLLPPRDNPLWATDLASGRRKWPFLACAPIVHPARFEGRGIIEQNADLARLFSGTFCLVADGMNWSVNQPTEVYQDALADWNDLDHYPGKLWVKKLKDQALMPAEIGQMKLNEALAFLQYVAQLTQNADFVTDFAVGLPGARSDITKGEVQIKTAQSLAIFEGMGKNIELGGREAVELTVNFLSQYLSDFTDPSVAQLIGPENAMFLMTLPLPERINELQGDFTYSFTGVSQALQKDDMLRRVVQFGQLAASVPYIQIIAQQAPQVFAQILVTLRDLLGLGDKITLPSEQAMLAPGAAGGVPAGPGPATAGPAPAAMQAMAAQAQAAGMANQGAPAGAAVGG
jgi:hypothetical protein